MALINAKATFITNDCSGRFVIIAKSDKWMSIRRQSENNDAIFSLSRNSETTTLTPTATTGAISPSKLINSHFERRMIRCRMSMCRTKRTTTHIPARADTTIRKTRKYRLIA